MLTEDRFGNESSSHLLERGALLGSTSAILGAPGIASVVALTETRVLWVAWRALITAGTRLGRIHGIVMKNLLESFCRKNYLMTQKIEVLSQKTLRERIIFRSCCEIISSTAIHILKQFSWLFQNHFRRMNQIVAFFCRDIHDVTS